MMVNLFVKISMPIDDQQRAGDELDLVIVAADARERARRSD